MGLHDDNSPRSPAVVNGHPESSAGIGQAVDEAGPRRTDTAQLAVVALASFIVWTGFGAILPNLSLFLRDNAHASLPLIGIITAGYAVGTFVFSAPLGRLSDSIGRKPVMVFGIFLYAVSTALLLTTTHPGWFFLFRLLEGIGTAAVSPTGNAFIAEISPEHERSRAYGWMTSAQFGGLAAGPMIGALLWQLFGGVGLWGFYSVFIFGSVASFASAIALAVVMREPPHAARRRREKVKRPPLRALLSKPILAFIVIAFTGNFAMGAFEVVWSIRLRDIGASLPYISYTWVAFSLPMLFSWVGGRIADRTNRFLLMFAGYSFASFCWVFYGLSTSLLALLIVNGLEGLAFALSFPAKQAFLIQVSPERWLGTITGLENSATQLAMLLGSLIAPLLYTAVGGFTFSIAGLISLAGLLVTAPILRRAWERIGASPAGVPGAPGSEARLAVRSDEQG
jgi:MFS transporter, DHA1 family, multidrug resistance protein